MYLFCDLNISLLLPGSLTARPWKMVGKEDDPFLLGPGNFSGAFAVQLRGCTLPETNIAPKTGGFQ